MRRIPRWVSATALTVGALAGAGAVVASASVAHTGSQVPVMSCIAPLNDGTYKKVPDGDAEAYDSGVYVCAAGSWVLDEDYGQ